MVKSSPAKLVAISETDPELIAEAKKLTSPDVRYYTDYKKMLDEVKPTMVWAFVENNVHHEVVEACGASVPVVAYGPHVHAERLRQAREAGCARVFPRSAFVKELAEIIALAKGC